MREFFPQNAVRVFWCRITTTTSRRPTYRPPTRISEKDASINEHIEQMRLSATKALMERADTIIVATVSAIYGLGDPHEYHGMVLHLKRGDTIDQRAILRRLAELQYIRNELDLVRGTYRVRGESHRYLSGGIRALRGTNRII